MQRIGMVGFGFCGSMVLAQLVRQATQPCIVYVFDPAMDPRGVAYSTPYAEHLLNVRASGMSAWPEEPLHFVQWLADAGHAFGPQDFVPRRIYGDYLQQQWQQTQEEAAAKSIVLKLIPSEAVALEAQGDILCVRSARGDAVALDTLVLATGHVTKPVALPIGMPVLQNPWAEGAVRQVAQHGGAPLLVGTGLTAVDMLLALRAEGYRGTVYAYSRRALWPQPHAAQSSPATLAAPLHTDSGVLGLLRQLRKQARDAHDWRSVVDGVRPITSQLWQALDGRAQQQFLQRLAPFWNIHRHRMALQIAAQLQAERKAGSLVVLRAAELSAHVETLGMALNCTGPELNLARMEHAFLRSALAQRMVEPHPTGQGLAADPRGRLWGDAYPRLYAMGGLRTGQLLESTAVPELRVQAQTIAEALCASISSK